MVKLTAKRELVGRYIMAMDRVGRGNGTAALTLRFGGETWLEGTVEVARVPFERKMVYLYCSGGYENHLGL